MKAVFRHAVHDPVEPVETVFARSRFKGGPAENADRKRIAAGLLHQLEIAIDDFRIFEPLIGIVVAAVKNFRRVTDDRAVMIHRCILPSSPKKLFYPRPPAPGLSGSPPESVRH